MRSRALGLTLLLAACRSVTPERTAEKEEAPDAPARVRDPVGAEVQRVRIEADAGSAVAVDVESKRLVTVSLSGTVRLWDLESGALLRADFDAAPSHHAHATVGRSPNGRWVSITRDPYQPPLLVDVRGGTIEPLPGSGVVRGISNDGRTLVRTNHEGPVIASRSSGQVLAQLQADHWRAAVFSDDGTRVFILDGDFDGALWSTRGQLLGRIPTFFDRDALRPPTLPDRLITWGEPCEVWNTRTAKKVRTLPSSGKCTVVARTPSGSHAAVVFFGAQRERLEVWTPDGEGPLWGRDLDVAADDVQLSADGRWLAAAGEQSWVVDLEHAQQDVRALPRGTKVAGTPDGSLFAVVSPDDTRVVQRDGSLAMHLATDGTPLFLGDRLLLSSHLPTKPSELWSIDGDRLAFVGGGGKAQHVRLRRDGAVLLAATDHGHSFWQTETGARLGECPAPGLLEDQAWVDDETIVRLRRAHGRVELDAFHWTSCKPVALDLPTLPPDVGTVSGTLLQRPRLPGFALALPTLPAIFDPQRGAVVLPGESDAGGAWSAMGDDLVRLHHTGPKVTDAEGHPVGNLGWTQQSLGNTEEAVALSSDGQRVAGIGGDMVTVYEVSSGDVLLELPLGAFAPMPDPPRRELGDLPAVAFSPSGSRLAARTVYGQFAVLDIASGQAVGEVANDASAFAWNQDSGELAVATHRPRGGKQLIRTYADDGQRRTGTIEAHGERVWQLQYVGDRLVIVGVRTVDIVTR